MADQPITGLPTKTASGVAATDKMLGIDSAEGYQILVQDVAKYIIENYGGSTLAGAARTPKAAIDLLNSKHIFLDEATGADANEFVKNLCTALNLPADRYVYTFACTWQNMGYVSGFVRRVKTSAGYNGMFKLSMSASESDKEYSFWSWDNVTFYANQIPTRAEFNTLNSNSFIKRGSVDVNTDINTVIVPGMYQLAGQYVHSPSSGSLYGSLYVYASVDANYAYITQLFVSVINGDSFIRTSNDKGSTWIGWIKQPTRTEVDTLNSKMPWTRLAEVSQGANASTDETVTVSDMTGAREVLLTIQRVSNGRTFASAVIPYAQFNGGAVYAFGSYILFADLLKNSSAIGVNAVCIWKSATQVEIAAAANDEALKFRFWVR